MNGVRGGGKGGSDVEVLESKYLKKKKKKGGGV